VSVEIKIDLKELYRRLPDKCKEELIKYIKEKLTEEIIRRQLESD